MIVPAVTRLLLGGALRCCRPANHSRRRLRLPVGSDARCCLLPLELGAPGHVQRNLAERFALPNRLGGKPLHTVTLPNRLGGKPWQRSAAVPWRLHDIPNRLSEFGGHVSVTPRVQQVAARLLAQLACK